MGEGETRQHRHSNDPQEKVMEPYASLLLCGHPPLSWNCAVCGCAIPSPDWFSDGDEIVVLGQYTRCAECEPPLEMATALEKINKGTGLVRLFTSGEEVTAIWRNATGGRAVKKGELVWVKGIAEECREPHDPLYQIVCLLLCT